jgi:hypothetical protein
LNAATAGSAFTAAGELQFELVYRAARNELAKRERYEGDPDKSRDHQQKPPQHIIAQSFTA